MNEALAYWRQLQAEVADSGAWTARVLEQEMRTGLQYQGKAAMLVAEPQLLTEAELADDQSVASAVVATLVAAGRQLLADPALQNRYTPGWLDGVPDADLFSVPAGYPTRSCSAGSTGCARPTACGCWSSMAGCPGGSCPPMLRRH